jgi:hypothetical protein
MPLLQRFGENTAIIGQEMIIIYREFLIFNGYSKKRRFSTYYFIEISDYRSVVRKILPSRL